MAGSAVTLFIGEDSIELLAVRGKRITRWANVPLEPGLVKDGLISNPEEVASRIKGILKAQRVNTRKMIVGLSGLHCLTRTIIMPHLQKSMLPEAIKREAELALPVPLDQLYLSWQVTSSTTNEIRIFLIASPRNTADALIQTMRLAGLKLYLVDLAPLAVARLAKGTSAVLADIRPAEVDIVVTVDGLPQFIRSQTYPGEAKTIQEKLLIAREEMERSINFYDTRHPDKPLDAHLPIYVSGKLVEETPDRQFLAGELNRSITPLLSPFKAPADFPATQFTVNIGLALKKIPAGNGSNASSINLNVLPQKYRPKPFPFGKFILAPMAALMALALLAYMVTTAQAALVKTASLQGQLDTANSAFQQRLVQQQALKEEVAELTKKFATMKANYDSMTAKVNNLAAIYNGFEQNRRLVEGALSTTTYALPLNVSLRSVNYIAGEVTIQGMSPDEANVLTYAMNLRQSGEFADVIISNMQQSQAGVTFILTLRTDRKG